MYEGRTRPKTVLWARYKLEKKLGRPLRADETVDHKDEDKTNDRISNLQVLTLAENSTKSADPKYIIAFMRSAKGRALASENARGEKNGLAKLTDKAVIRLRKEAKAGLLSRKSACAQYGISDRSLRNAITGVTYSHLPHASRPFSKTGRPSTYTEADIAKWRRYINSGMSVRQTSIKFGVSARTIYRTINS